MGKKFLGVEFAPLSVPLDRRLQTLAVLLVTNFNVFAGFFFSFLFIYILLTKYYWIALLYAAWWIYDRPTSSTGGRRLECARRFFTHKYVKDFFPVNLVKTADLDPNNKFLIGYHPHGLISIGAYINFATEATGFSGKFPGVRPHLLTLKLLHMFPVFREYLSILGVCDVSRQSIHNIFQTKGNAAIIVIGGAKEAMDAHPRMTNVVLKSRKGFIKMAFIHGAQLVPSFSFGENDIYRMMINNAPGSYVRAFQRGFQKIIGIPPLVFSGRGIFNYTLGPVPFRRPVTTVIGKPILVEQDANPTQEKIDTLHKKYMEELERLFNEHKGNYGYENEVLEFID